jgi:hypothetical protein
MMGLTLAAIRNQPRGARTIGGMMVWTARLVRERDKALERKRNKVKR